LESYLSQFCNASSAYFEYYDCDCDEFDLVSGTGTIGCVVYDDCYDYLFSSTACYVITAEGTFNDDGNYTGTYCLYFFLPYNQTVCYSYSSLGGCAISFDDVTCNACVETEYTYNYTNYTFGCILTLIARTR
jgi:hypothetical protein